MGDGLRRKTAVLKEERPLTSTYFNLLRLRSVQAAQHKPLSTSRSAQAAQHKYFVCAQHKSLKETRSKTFFILSLGFWILGLLDFWSV